MANIARMNKIRSQRGLTLVELMVAMVIFAILAAVAIPTFLNGLPTYRLRSAARDLTGRMQKARQLAVKNNVNATLAFDTVNNRYTISQSGAVVETVDLSGYGSGVRFGSGSATADATTTPAAIDPHAPIKVTFSSNDVAFTPAGFADGMGYCYLQNDDGGAFAIGTIISGVIYLKKWGSSGWN